MRQALHLLVLAVVLFVLLPVPLLCAEEGGALLENITFDRQSSSRETVSFKLNGPHIPKIFAMKGDAPKVVFDFYDTRHSASIKGVLKSRGNLVTAIRAGMHTDPRLKTRVVLDLVPAVDYDFAQQFREKDNTLIITIFHAQSSKGKGQGLQAGGKTKKNDLVPAQSGSSLGTMKKETVSLPQVQEKQVKPPSAPPAAVAGKKPPVPSSSQLVINTISFEKIPDKGEKVSFHLTNFHPPVVFGIEEGTPTIVCDFMDARIGEAVPEIITANGRFVKQIRVEKKVDLHKIRVVLELVANQHYDLQQVYFKEENLYVLSVNSDAGAGAGTSEKP